MDCSLSDSYTLTLFIESPVKCEDAANDGIQESKDKENKSEAGGCLMFKEQDREI